MGLSTLLPGSGSTSPTPDAWTPAIVRWASLWSAPRLALRPACIGLGAVLVVVVSLIGRLPRLWLAAGDGGPAALAADRALEGIAAIKSGVIALHPSTIADGLKELVFGTPAEILSRYPWSTWAVFLPAAIVLAIGGGAISRLAALDFVRHPTIPWPKALGFALRRAGGFASAMLAPPVLAALLIGVLALLGLILWRVPIIQIVGALAFPLLLVAGLLAVLLVVGNLLGLAMFVPALACEGSDAIDAIQRVYAYVVTRPLRTLLCGLLLLTQLIVVVSVAQSLSDIAVRTTLDATSAITPAPHDWLMDPTRSTPPANASMSMKATMSIVGLWCKLPGVLVAGLGLSLFFSGGTICYLLLRQACDGQDPLELWHPGKIPGIARVEDDGDSGESDF